ncbi:hypothetical protein [Runella limosa]|uniref:hypothetical protein n=1 Tax=Runella limosa TaxID=370978 RepID=UPI0003FBD49B|nr:hypothetical protein [Runella limosa]
MSDLLKHKLPTYTPPESVWEAVEQGLNEAPLKEALQHLPMHEPPAQVWLELTESLPTARPLRWWRYAAAATITGLLCFVGYVFLHSPSEDTKLTYSQEKAFSSALPAQNEAIDQQYEQLQAFCETKTPVCEKPEFKDLKQQLDELTIASRQLKEALGEYNTDASLSSQLSDIEHERAELLKKLSERI